jgi:hypothetical protein
MVHSPMKDAAAAGKLLSKQRELAKEVWNLLQISHV